MSNDYSPEEVTREELLDHMRQEAIKPSELTRRQLLDTMRYTKEKAQDVLDGFEIWFDFAVGEEVYHVWVNSAFIRVYDKDFEKISEQNQVTFRLSGRWEG